MNKLSDLKTFLSVGRLVNPNVVHSMIDDLVAEQVANGEAAVAAVDHGGRKAEVFNDSMSSGGKYYYRTKGYSPGDPLDTVLSDRYTDFNKRLGTKVKLRVQFNLLQEAIYQAELK